MCAGAGVAARPPGIWGIAGARTDDGQLKDYSGSQRRTPTVRHGTLGTTVYVLPSNLATIASKRVPTRPAQNCMVRTAPNVLGSGVRGVRCGARGAGRWGDHGICGVCSGTVLHSTVLEWMGFGSDCMVQYSPTSSTVQRPAILNASELSVPVSAGPARQRVGVGPYCICAMNPGVQSSRIDFRAEHDSSLPAVMFHYSNIRRGI